MAKKKETEEKIKETPVEETAEDREAEIRLKELTEKLEASEQALAEEKDRYLRLLAEYDNFKKRTVKEKEDLYFAAKSDVIRRLLPVFDNFDRAATVSDPEQFKAGVDMIISQFFQILEGMEVRQIAAEGDEFDPVFHEAVFREEKEGIPENHITEVLQKGYAIGDKVIRHAMVKVSAS